MNNDQLKEVQKNLKLLIGGMSLTAAKPWLMLAGAAFVLFHFFSDWDYSVLLTTSSLISMFSFLMVLLKVWASKSYQGVSRSMMECYVVVYACRLCAIVPFEGYLPLDRSGDWLYQFIEFLSLVLCGLLVYLGRKVLVTTYNAGADTLNHRYLLIGCAVLAVFMHPSLNRFSPVDIAWATALYVEATCVMAQLFMFQKCGKVEAFTTHFLMGQAVSRLLSFIFWFSSYGELNDASHAIRCYVGHWVMIVQLFQLIIMGDFIYHYIQCIRKGIAFENILVQADYV